MSKTQALGIGCFWFSPRKAVTENPYNDIYDWKGFLSNIKAALESVDNVSEVEVDDEFDHLRLGFLFEENSFDENADNIAGEFIPMYSNLKIEFKIYLPYRVQKQYSHGTERKLETENFRVIIYYGIDMPVAYICQDIDKIEKGVAVNSSTAVMVIRKYFEEKLQNNEHCKFGSLGPSPFHADISLNIKQGMPEEILAKNVSSGPRGYEDIAVDITIGKGDDPLDAFIYKYHSILESYYNLVWLRNKSLSNVVHIVNGAKAIFENSKSKKNFIKRLSENKALVDSVYEKILDDKLNRIEIEGDVAQRTRSEFITKENVFYPFIEREIEEIPKAPVDEIIKILSISEERRQKYFANISTLFAGLVGGIIGALIGTLLSYKLAHLEIPLSSTVKYSANQITVNPKKNGTTDNSRQKGTR